MSQKKSSVNQHSAAADSVTDQDTPDASPVPVPGAKAAVGEAVPAFRVGEYELGFGSCSELCGHPDILY
jgi:hypothetical protein